jgi:hypothetical protein
MKIDVYLLAADKFFRRSWRVLNKIGFWFGLFIIVLSLMTVVNFNSMATEEQRAYAIANRQSALLDLLYLGNVTVTASFQREDGSRTNYSLKATRMHKVTDKDWMTAKNLFNDCLVNCYWYAVFVVVLCFLFQFDFKLRPETPKDKYPKKTKMPEQNIANTVSKIHKPSKPTDGLQEKAKITQAKQQDQVSIAVTEEKSEPKIDTAGVQAMPRVPVVAPFVDIYEIPVGTTGDSSVTAKSAVAKRAPKLGQDIYWLSEL